MSKRIARATSKLVEKCANLQKQIDQRDASKQRPVLEGRIKELQTTNLQLTTSLTERDSTIKELQTNCAVLSNRVSALEKELDAAAASLAAAAQ